MRTFGDVFTDLTDVNRKFLITILHIFIKPETVVQSYLDEKDIYSSPLRYMITLVTISVLASLLAFKSVHFVMKEGSIIRNE